MKTEFYIVRHGQTLFNIKKRFQGWCDSPLTEKGIQEAKQVHESLKDIDFVYAVSSSSERAIDTLNIILGNRQIPSTYDKGLRETFFGDLEGAYVPDVKPTDEQDWIGYAYCGGENREEAYQRFKKTLENYAKDGNVLVVSHGAVIARMVQHLDPVAWEEKEGPVTLVPNCSLTRIRYENGQFTLLGRPSIDYLK